MSSDDMELVLTRNQFSIPFPSDKLKENITKYLCLGKVFGHHKLTESLQSSLA